MIRAVLYDIGGVLFTTQSDSVLRNSFASRLLELLKQRGIQLPGGPEEFGERLGKRSEEYKTHSEVVKYELPSYRIWKEFYLADYQVPDRELMACAEELSCFFDSQRSRRIPRPNVKETMAALYGMGVRQGVISNIISRDFAPQLMREYGVEGYLEIITQSSEAGFRKPDPRIFEMTLTRMGIAKGECAYVGDTISRDIIGARSAELGAVIQIKSDASARRDGAYLLLGYKPDYLIQDLMEIPEIVARRNRGE